MLQPGDHVRIVSDFLDSHPTQLQRKWGGVGITVKRHGVDGLWLCRFGEYSMALSEDVLVKVITGGTDFWG